MRTVQAWLAEVGADAGPLFRSINRHGRVCTGRLSGIDVARVVKKLAERAGLDATAYTGHSLSAMEACSGRAARGSSVCKLEFTRAAIVGKLMEPSEDRLGPASTIRRNGVAKKSPHWTGPVVYLSGNPAAIAQRVQGLEKRSEDTRREYT
jgi:hypothetical protein